MNGDLVRVTGGTTLELGTIVLAVHITAQKYRMADGNECALIGTTVPKLIMRH